MTEGTELVRCVGGRLETLERLLVEKERASVEMVLWLAKLEEM